MKQRTKLMIPGPVDVWDETLEALGRPVVSNFTEDWAPIQTETIALLKKIFQTQNDLFILTSAGSGAVEMGVASIFSRGEKVAAVSNGPFALRSIEILRAYDCDVVEIENGWGCGADLDQVEAALKQHPDVAGLVVVANETGTGVRNPVKELAQLAHAQDIPILVDAISGMGGYDLPVDKWELDVLCTSSNKALETPPGLGFISVSERAWDTVDAKQADGGRGWYYNLANWKKYREQGRYAPTTMATSMIVGLRASLKRIVEVETLQGHWDRYAWAQKAVRTGLRNIGFDMLAPDDVASFTVSAVCKHPSMEHEQEVRDFLNKEYGFVVSGTWGKTIGQAFRVSHMGRASSSEYLIPFLLGIEEFLRTEKGIDVPLGASLVGVEQPGY
ncbi:MAG: alanine--glyoxylate aminotransferase family protein [Caldilineaceae bacterium]|nr:alanine--glyoxylate aminotransferase family protein [Caldilineaceae bacterium]